MPLALYVIDIDGSRLLRVAGTKELPKSLKAPLAVGPELDSDGLSELRDRLDAYPGIEVVPLWLRGRATGVILTLGRPRNSLTEIARQAAAATTLADRYTDAFAAATRTQTTEAGGGDSTEPAPASNQQSHGRRGGRQHSAELRGGRRLVRRDRELGRGLDHARGWARWRHSRRRQQRCGTRCAPSAAAEAAAPSARR